MSLRDRLRGVQAAPRRPSEREAALSLATQRGRAPIAPAPNAGKAAARVLREHLPKGAGIGLREIQRRWDEIAGPSFAGRTAPEKLAAGVLTLRAPGALAPFLQSQGPLLIERLKLAGAAVKSIRIEQRSTGPAKGPNVRPLKRKLGPEEEAALSRAFENVADPGLKSALMRLGRAVKER